MKHKWFITGDSSNLIIFYTGWGMGAESVALKSLMSDVLVFYDYRDISIESELINKINQYNHLTIVAWSLGVVPATCNRNLYNADRMIAINGSLFPASDKYGIPEAVYQGTHDNLEENSLGKFIKRMFLSNEHYAKFHIQHNPAQIKDLKDELMSIKEISLGLKYDDKNYFDIIIVCEKDRIFPVDNMMSMWLSPVVLGLGHYPFFEFNTWEELINAR